MVNIEGFEDKNEYGNRPNGFYIPRFRNLNSKSKKVDFLRGYGYQVADLGLIGVHAVKEIGYGEEFKKAILEPGNWQIGMGGFGEVLPYHENRMFLDYNDLDKWGLPKIVIDAEFKENELKMKKDWIEQAEEMLELAGCREITTYDSNAPIGRGIHEMGQLEWEEIKKHLY